MLKAGTPVPLNWGLTFENHCKGYIVQDWIRLLSAVLLRYDGVVNASELALYSESIVQVWFGITTA